MKIWNEIVLNDLFTAEIILKVFLALVLGGLIGFERTISRKQAGLRTFALVSLGACLFIIEALELSKFTTLETTGRVLSNIVVGIGFLGGGLIFMSAEKIVGLTTAAALWVTSAIGAAIGLGFYRIAIITTLIILIILRVVGIIEGKIRNKLGF